LASIGASVRELTADDCEQWWRAAPRCSPRSRFVRSGRCSGAPLLV
jgi:hypothetical protein